METIKEFRKRLTEYVNQLRENQDEEELNKFCRERQFSREVVDDAGIFYIAKNVDMLIPEFLSDLRDFGVISHTNGKPIYADRYVIPIYDMEGLVMGLVGYSLTAKERYMYANTIYFNRNDILYGMEMYHKCLEDGYAIITEGITDRLRVIQLGYENCMSTAGAHKSLFMMMVLNMIPIIIFIPDRDRAGDGTKEYWKTNNYGRLLIPFIYKDLDEYACNSQVSANNLREYIGLAINYMKDCKEKGITILGEEMPIYEE